MRKKFKNIAMLLAFLLGIISPVDGQVVEAKANPTNATQSEDNGIPTNRIIVKYKDGTSAPFTPSYTPQQIEDRVSAASAVELDYVRPMGEGDTHVLQLSERMSIAEVEAITQQIETLPEIEYAEPDRIYTVALDPNDPAYDNNNQWNLNGTWGINAPEAWDITDGETSIVVAVVDTGYTEHPELDGRLIEEGGNVYGYDFINFATEANDGNERDTDPSDPGDWVTDAENDAAPFVGCPVTNSTWHGTHVAGIIGAQTNNGADIAGIDWEAKILPVRVLGKCGGYLSDIADGMRWAAGLTVSGVPANLHPADIINLSLGGPGACSVTEQNAITAIVEAGVVVVAAAGNTNENVSGYSPANCNGVISVAATDIDGEKAGYSNFGAGIHISAPGGDDGDQIWSTSNTGTTVPVGHALEEKSGTSMAAPHVSGVLALMFAVNPNLEPEQALQLLQNTAKDFPGGGSCNTTNCGSGIVDAAAAVAAAEAPDLIVTGYELRNEDNNATITQINANEAFHIRLTIKNQGGDNAGNFYPGVFLDGKPNYGPDNDDYPFGQITYFDDFKIIYGSNGCLAYDPEENLDPMGDTCNSVRGNYTIFDFPPPLPAGASTTIDVYIGYPEDDYPNPDYDAVDVRTGLPSGTYQIYLYADPSGTVAESIEDNNELGPVTINIGTQVDVTIGGALMGSYTLSSGEEKRLYYDVSGGPVKVESTDDSKIVSAIRLQSFTNNTLYSFVETMGVPDTLLSHKYYFPTYNNTFVPYLNSQIRFGNLNATSTTVRVTIGGDVVWEDSVPAFEERRLNFPISGGPVIIESLDPLKKIVAAIRLQSFANDTLLSFSETMGIPDEYLSNKYYFPTYNNTFVPYLNSQIRFGNLDDTSTIVRITIGGDVVWEDSVPAFEERRLNFPVSGGPVIIESLDPLKKIVAAIRLQSFTNNTMFSFVETMGVPEGLLSHKYYFPTYNNTWPYLNSQIRFGNLDATATTVRVTIGGDIVWEESVPAFEERRLNFPVSGGPVIIESLNSSKKIVAAIRLQSFTNNTMFSFSETMGIPDEFLSDTYYFPTYNNTWPYLNSQLRFGVP